MGVRSQNGWPANDVRLTSSRPVPGSKRKLRVVDGPAGDLLLWVAGQFDRLVEDIDAGQLDDWGYAERAVRGGTDLSNHASGTAIDLNALLHILGAAPRASFTQAEVALVHAVLNRTRYNGRNLVRWGGDYVGRKDPMHFEINDGVTAGECAALLKILNKPAHVTEDNDMQPTDKTSDPGPDKWGHEWLNTKQNAAATRAKVDALQGDFDAFRDQVTDQLNKIAAGVARLEGNG